MAVVANGGTVSGSTLKAVSNFCRDIDATSGLRAAILRLNLFCGSNLSACLVPLYRGASRTGTQLGNTTDTNNNFVSGDYVETGASGGLKGNATTKTINTGFNINNVSLLSSHLSFSAIEIEVAASGVFRTLIGGFGGSASAWLGIQNNQTTSRYFGSGLFNGPNFGFNATEAHAIGTRTSDSNAVAYRSGLSVATYAIGPAGNSPNATAVEMFANTAMRGRMYSIGNGLTAAQALAFSNAVIAFNTALGRT